MHVSEVDTPGGRLEDHFVVGQWVRARILRIDDQEHKVGSDDARRHAAQS